MKIGIFQKYWGRVGGGQRYVGVVAQALAQRHDVEIVHHCPGFEPAAVAEGLEVDLSQVAFRYVPCEDRPAWPTRNPLARLRLERDWRREISAGYDLFIDSSDVPPYFCHAKRGALLVHFPLVSRDDFHGRVNGQWHGTPWPARVAKAQLQNWEWRSRMSTYQLCVVNSNFTRGWIRRRWGLDARVLYPPLRGGLAPADKENLILTIGAFNHSGHKRHDVLIDAFRALCDAGLRDWRYLVVGACGGSDADRAYLSKLRERAAGYPIELRTDVASAELRDLLGRAALLWHSMGFGVDPQAEPQRMEHFGMVVSEAQAAGCVPMAFRGGGIPEIIAHGENGVLWADIAELNASTLQLAQQPDRRQAMAAAAHRRAEAFGPRAFEANLYAAFAPVLE
jgi:glycosyltransferase involved in cell wall biosynthesis